jgi:hypothetical protein
MYLTTSGVAMVQKTEESQILLEATAGFCLPASWSGSSAEKEPKIIARKMNLLAEHHY